MQPTYLPWSGYFNLMACVDVFVYLDDVQFERRSWQSRNRILVNGREHLLTVPVRKASQQTILSEIETAPDEWMKSHWQTLRAAYANAGYGKEMLSLLEPAFGDSPRFLAETNCRVIALLADALDIRTRTVRASDLGCPGHRSEHLISICRRLECAEYLSPQGSREYLEDDGFASRSGISLTFQSFDALPYPQVRATNFVSHLSVIDVIANMGLEYARQYIRRPGSPFRVEAS